MSDFNNIGSIWKTLRRTHPSLTRTPTSLYKQIQLKQIEVELGVDKLYIVNSTFFYKKRLIDSEISLTGLTLQDDVNIDSKLLMTKDKIETHKGFLLAVLLAKGIFNNKYKREAFIALSKKR